MNASLASGVGSITNCVRTDLVVVQDGPCVDREGGTQLEGGGEGDLRLKTMEKIKVEGESGEEGWWEEGCNTLLISCAHSMNNYTCIYTYTLYICRGLY